MNEKSYATEKGAIRYWVNDLKPGAITLVFLPGLTADHRLFDKQIEFFEPRCNVLVWDAPGHAASRPFELSFSLADKARWLNFYQDANLCCHALLPGTYIFQVYNNGNTSLTEDAVFDCSAAADDTWVYFKDTLFYYNGTPYDLWFSEALDDTYAEYEYICS